MKVLLITLLVLAVAAGVVYISTKYFKAFKDLDNDGIPDEVEEKVAETKATVKKTVKVVKNRAKRVKEELNDVVAAAKDVVAQSKDVAEAVKGGARKGRKPSTPKKK
jgi:predicted Holliday junction resolvase-like endonuclease